MRNQTTKSGCLKRQNVRPGTLETSRQIVLFEDILPLTPEERNEWSECRKQFSRGFCDMCMALARIEKKRLYREEYPTFEEFSRKALGWSRSYTYRHTAAARVIQILLDLTGAPMPDCESQVRPLTKLPPEAIPAVWRKAVDDSGSGTVTAASVQKAILQTNGRADHDQENSHLGEWSSLELNLLRIVRTISKLIKQHELSSVQNEVEKLRMRLELESQKEEWSTRRNEGVVQ
jgi:hypothetical protein